MESAGAERAYRQPYYQETKTFGDYDVGAPPGLPQQNLAPEPEPAMGKDHGKQATQDPKPEPTAVDVLITGMAQLQQLLLRKSDGLDVEAKGTPELPKLGEYNPETGAIEFQDFLYLVEQQVGSLASGAGEWWQKTLQVAQAAYMEYQTLSPVKRLGVKAQLSEELKDDRFKRLEKKVAAMLLCALPKGVKDDLIAYRVQGVHQILYRLMVIFQPGGAQDRAQILRQLDVSESAAGAPEAVVAIRKWYRLLQRASDLGVTLPDESLQVKSLSAIVRKTSEQNSDFRFRLALARTELQIDTRPNQANVLKYMQHLLAELECNGNGNSVFERYYAKPGAKPKAAPNAGTKKPCQWFGTDNGCRNGKNCNFLHSWSGLSRAERCLLCGSKKHRAKECTNGKSDSSPERGGAAQLAKAQAPRPPSTTAEPAPVDGLAAASDAGISRDTASSSATTTPNKIDPAQMTEILNETNKMLKAFTASQASLGASSSVDPLAAIQQQLDEVRRLKTIVVREPALGAPSFQRALSWYEQRLSSSTVGSLGAASTDEALLDSGASHPFRPASTDEELRDARRVVVSLATGEERAILQTKEGTLLSEGSNEPPLVPMGQLVTLLGCTVRWSPTRLSVVHPVHGKLSVKLRGPCPVIPVGQALALIAEMEQARMEEFERTVNALSVQMKMLRDQGRDEWPWKRHLQALREDGDRTSMAGFVHRCPTFAALPPEVLLGLPEAVPRGAKDGWKLLKGLPWSRAKRKTLYQSDSWVVHLFSGDDRPREAKEQSLMRRSFWSGALEGGDVLVDVDVTASKAMDLRQQGAVFRLLSWAALNGKIKAIIGGPPRHSFPRPGQNVAAAGQPLKETQLIARMLALWYMAEEGRCFAWRQGLLKSPPVKPHVGFMLEHPRSADGDDPRHSIFQTLMWKTFADEELMGEVPCVINGRPSVLAGNLDLWHLRDESVGALEAQHPAGSIWPLELVVEIAGAVCSWKGLRNREGLLASLIRVAPPEDFEHVGRLAKFNAGEWKLHLQNDHLPYRRDCRVCVEKASGRPHRRISHPSAYSLAIDLAGPFRNVGAGGYKYLMVGCYRFPKLVGVTKAEEEAEKLPAKAPDDGDDWLFDELEPPAEVAREEVGEELPPPPEEADDEAERADKEIEALKELAKPLEFSSVYLARPMKSRTKKDALRAVQELYVQLRSSGFPLSKLHMDRARELQTDVLDAWAAARDIEVFTKRKGYGVGGGHLVFTDEGSLWYTTSIRQFDNPPADVEVGPRGDLAAEYLREERFSMNDCLEVLENEVFRKTRKQRSSAWKDHPPPPVHSTLGAYQRGPWKGVTTATSRHESLTAYLVAMFKHHCGKEVLFTSMTVAKDLCTDAHRDRFNLWSSTNYVITVGAFDGGGIWQEGHCEGAPEVSVQVNEKEAVQGYVLPVRDRVVQVNPKKLHKTMPWQGGPKWTVIAHTIGQHEKLPPVCRDELQSLGFPLPPPAELKMIQSSGAEEENGEPEGSLSGPSWFPPPDDPEEEMWTRMWTRRLLDEEEVLTSTVPKELQSDFQAVAEVNGELADSLPATREEEHHKDRYDAAQWLVLCKLAEGEDEVRGVESLLEALPGPLKVVYTVALDEVKQFVDRWSGAIVKEADALIQAKALVPLSIEQQKALEASGKLIILPAKGVFTVKPPDEEVLVGPDGK
ncbi:GIP, partial [Symbiodinium microadriaticum]